MSRTTMRHRACEEVISVEDWTPICRTVSIVYVNVTRRFHYSAISGPLSFSYAFVASMGHFQTIPLFYFYSTFISLYASRTVTVTPTRHQYSLVMMLILWSTPNMRQSCWLKLTSVWFLHHRVIPHIYTEYLFTKLSQVELKPLWPIIIFYQLNTTPPINSSHIVMAIWP